MNPNKLELLIDVKKKILHIVTPLLDIEFEGRR